MTAVGRPLPDGLVLDDVEVDERRVSVRVAGHRVAAVGPDVRPEGRDVVLDGAGGALLPGLHDHHLHLRSLAAALASVSCGPPEVTDRASLRAALRSATAHHGWIRGVGYHASVAGDLDRHAVDELRADVAVRIQDRSGIRWHCNSAAVDALDLGESRHPGIERDVAGRPNGRLVRADDLLAARAPRAGAEPHEVGGLLARHGVTGCTDATVTNDDDAMAWLAGSQRTGALPQRLHVLGRLDLAPPPPGAPQDGDASVPGRLSIGGVKVVLDEHDLPPIGDLIAIIRGAHRAGRGVAVHAVTRATLALCVAAFDAAGTHPGDRVEHASVCPPGLAERIVDLALTVVTQPNLIGERGEHYRREVDPEDRPWLYPVGSMLSRGVRVAGSTDAPFGRPDPWAAIRSAADRLAPDGAPLGPEHAIPARRALELFLGPLDDPAGSPRRVVPGAAADLCLLDRPLAEALRAPDAEHVRLVVVGGRLVGGGDPT